MPNKQKQKAEDKNQGNLTPQKEKEKELAFSEEAMPFYGIENGAISLRGGGATVLIELDGFDFDTSGPAAIGNLGEVLAQATKAACKIGGVATSGVTVSFTVLQRRMDLARLISANRKASEQADQTGLAAFARNEEEYLQGLAQENPFVQRRNFLAISLNKKAYQAELDEADQARQAGAGLEDELWLDATPTTTSAADDAISNTSLRSKANRKKKPLTLKEKFIANFNETIEDAVGGGAAARAAFSSSNISGIQLNPVPQALAFTLRQKAEIFLNALRQLGLGGRLLDSRETAEVLAQILGLPVAHPGYLEAALDREIKLHRVSKAGKHKANPTLPLQPLQTEAQATQAQNESLYVPTGGNRWGTLDSTRFSYAPFEFKSRYLRVGLPPSLATKLTEFRQVVGGQRKNLLHNEGLSLSDGKYWQLPRPSYMTTLYSTDWPRQITMGQLFGLVTRPDLEIALTVQLVPVPKRQAQSKLEKQRLNVEIAQETDQSNKTFYERREQIAAIEGLQNQIAAEDGLIIMAGLRVAVRADSLVELNRAAKSVAGTLSGAGITVTPALYNQAIALYSALPLGRDYLRQAPLFGKRTVRNMTAQTAACLFPALVPEQADENGIFVGRGTYGGITCISTDKLLAPHGLTYGASGAGKTVSKQADISRRLAADPDLSCMYIDPQGVLVKLAYELGGTVLDMSAEAEKKVRLNFLDRFIMGGRPMPFGDLSTIFTTFLALMQNQTLASTEKAAVTSALKRLARHYELGESLTPMIVQGLKNRFYAPLHLAEAGQLEVLEETLEAIYTGLQEQFHIPEQGYTVQVGRDPKSGLPRLCFSSRENERAFRASQGQSCAEDAAIELNVLNTHSLVGSGRNYYAGGGSSRVQIPLAAFDRLEREIATRKAGGELDRNAWLSLALLRYLCSPQPRREAGQCEWLIPHLQPGSHSENQIMSDPAIAATHLVAESGPCWYAADEWSELVAVELADQFESCGLFDDLSKEETATVLRDLLVGVKFGVPILSDLLPILSAELHAQDLVRNLEMFADPDLAGALFNGHTNVDLQNRFIVFDVKNVTDELRPLRMMQCMQLSWRLITSNPVSKGKRFLFVVDEFGVIANQAPEVASYIGILYKRSRAFGCTMWLIDQDTTSLQSLAGRHAISNAGIVEIMRQDAQDLAYWQQMFNLTQEEVDTIGQFGQGEVMILLREPSRTRKIRSRYTMSEATLRILSTKQADVKQYIEEQQLARGIKGDQLAEMLEDLIGHNFSN